MTKEVWEQDVRNATKSGAYSGNSLPAQPSPALSSPLTWPALPAQVDSKKELEKQLKGVCEAFIMALTKVGGGVRTGGGGAAP